MHGVQIFTKIWFEISLHLSATNTCVLMQGWMRYEYRRKGKETQDAYSSHVIFPFLWMEAFVVLNGMHEFVLLKSVLIS